MASSASLPVLLGSATLLTVLGFIAGKSTGAKSASTESFSAASAAQPYTAQFTTRRTGSNDAFAALTGEGFFDKLTARAEAINSLLCVGLDPHVGQLEQKTARGAFEFCKRLIDATTDVALAYKPNAAFFEAFGAEGMAALKDVVQYIPADIPVVLDAKRGDIGTTAQAYADAAYNEIGAESITINAYMGTDTVTPFIKDASRGVFILCKTSNPSSAQIQTLQISSSSGSVKHAVYEEIALLAETEWNTLNNVGLVVGATDAIALQKTRAIAPNVWILAPGIGAQGGDLTNACISGLDSNGMGLLIPISRGISTSNDPNNAAISYRDQINTARASVLAKKNEEDNDKEECSATSSSTSIEPFQKEFIEFALSQNVLKFGTFTLKSGRQSPYFFNAGLFSTGQSLAKLGKYYAQAIVNAGTTLKFDVIFGPAYKGIPLGAAVAYTLYDKHGQDVGYSYNRKEKKDHGEGGLLVGDDLSGKRVLIIDDVITAGTAIREAIDILVQANAIPAGVVIALDRQEKGKDSDLSAVQQVIQQFDIPVVSVIGLNQIATYLTSSNDPKLLQDINEYRDQYGITIV